jgi:hypothetical protein
MPSILWSVSVAAEKFSKKNICAHRTTRAANIGDGDSEVAPAGTVE